MACIREHARDLQLLLKKQRHSRAKAIMTVLHEVRSVIMRLTDLLMLYPQLNMESPEDLV
jgi:hypothetical protein